jgi:hypothetical protein
MGAATGRNTMPEPRFPSVETDGPVAYCARHPDERAVITCARCGSYACVRCVGIPAGGKQYCVDCNHPAHEALRKQYGSHERQVRAIALLYWLGAGAGLFSMVAYVVMAATVSGDGFGPVALLAPVISLPLFGALGLAAYGLQRLNRLGRILGSVIAFFGLFGFPIGTLINLFILWVLLGKKGSMVFSDEYRAAVASTPHLDYGVSTVTKVFLAILVALIVAAAVFSMFA